MGAEGGSESTGSQRWAAFLTYAHDDNSEYIKDFYEAFTKTLRSYDVTAEVFLDDSHNDRFGDVKKYFRERASLADFLIIFVGNHYPQRPFCLYEWSAFRAQFQNKSEAQERLCIIEIDDGAIDKLERKAREPQASERAAEIADSFHEKRLIKDGQRIVSEVNGRPNQEFEERVKKITAGFAKKYNELRTHVPVRVEPQQAGVASVLPLHSPDVRTREADVVIAAATPDLDSAIAELSKELDRANLTTQQIGAHYLSELNDTELRERLRAGKWLVQPFSWHRVTNARTPGGHLIRQVALFGRPERALFWRPKGALDRNASGDPAAKVEQRPEHVETLEALRSERTPVASHHGVIFGEPANVVRLIVPPDPSPDPPPPNGPPARIMWELEPEIADQLELASNFTKERCIALSPELSVRNLVIELKDILSGMPDWAQTAHGLVLADYAKSTADLLRSVKKVWDHLDKTQRDIPIIVFVIDRETARVAVPPSIFFKSQEQPRKMVVEKEKELEKLDSFLQTACAIARNEAVRPHQT